MLKAASIDALKVTLVMEELQGLLYDVIDKAGENLSNTAKSDVNYGPRYVASEAKNYGETIGKCYEILGLLDTIRDGIDEPVENVYRRIFRNDPVALNLEKMV